MFYSTILIIDFRDSKNLLYNWQLKYTSDNDKTKYATLEEENRALHRELAEMRMERDMLKKAAAYFANSETAQLHVAEGVSQIITNRPAGEGSLANNLLNR